MVKKNQIIITGLAVMVAVAGYLNYAGTKIGTKSAVSTIETEGELVDIESLDEDVDITAADTTTPGEAVLTSTGAGDFAAEARLTREQVRAQSKETLLEVINNEAVGEQQKQEAVESMSALTENAEKEAAAELLLESKGFKDSVVSITEESADVVVGKTELSDAERAQIEDIVKRKTEVAGENIVITSMAEESK